jgi:hypothetical protein
MIAAHRFWINRMPIVAWHVGGRKLFARQSPKIRAMWKVGDYRRMQSCRACGKETT